MIILSREILKDKINEKLENEIVDNAKLVNMSIIECRKYLLEAKSHDELLERFNTLFKDFVKIV